MKTDAKLIANIVGISAVVIVAGWILYSTFAVEETSGCDVRYQSATTFGFRSQAGKALSAPELQAQVGSSEWGILDNVRIGAMKGAPSDLVMDVKLAQGAGSGFHRTSPRGGIGFTWTPFEMRDAQAACLAYEVYVPPNFEFAGAGSFPGLYVGRDFNPRGEPLKGSGTGTRISWDSDGDLSITGQFANDEGWQNIPLAQTKVKLARGRWQKLEQELVLNDPSRDDGILRLWIDGKLAYENNQIAMRREASMPISGVLGDVFYGSVFNTSTAPKDVHVRLSPFMLRWQ